MPKLRSLKYHFITKILGSQFVYTNISENQVKIFSFGGRCVRHFLFDKAFPQAPPYRECLRFFLRAAGGPMPTNVYPMIAAKPCRTIRAARSKFSAKWLISGFSVLLGKDDIHSCARGTRSGRLPLCTQHFTVNLHPPAVRTDSVKAPAAAVAQI